MKVLLRFLLPISSGEIVKTLILKRLSAIPISRSLPTVTMDRLLEGMAFWAVTSFWRYKSAATTCACLPFPLRIPPGSKSVMWRSSTATFSTQTDALIAPNGTDNRHSIDKARTELGYAPQVSIREGIQLACNWYKQKHSSDALVPLAAGGSD